MSFAIHHHWEEAFGAFDDWYRVRDHFDLINGYPFKSENFNADGVGKPLVRIRDLLGDELPTFFDGEDGKDIVVKDGDIVVGMDGDFNSVTWKKGEALLNQRVCALRPKDHSGVDSRLLGYQIPISLKIVNDLTPWSTVRHLSSLDVLALRFPKFDLPTQRAIADFLDRETARIDTLIEKKQRLVELLGEKRSTQLEFLLFDSGFELRKLRREALVISKGTTPSTIGADMVNEGIRFLKAENVTWNGVSGSPENYISEETHRTLKRSALQAFDVLVVIAGATTGKTTVMPAEFLPANTNQAVSFVRLKQSRYSGIVCASIGCRRIQRDILLTSVQSAQPNLSMENLGNLMLPFPRTGTIDAVLGKIENINRTTSKVADVAIKSIDRLKEYRSAIITSAVTGQIDLTKWTNAGTTDRQLDAIEEEFGA